MKQKETVQNVVGSVLRIRHQMTSIEALGVVNNFMGGDKEL